MNSDNVSNFLASELPDIFAVELLEWLSKSIREIGDERWLSVESEDPALKTTIVSSSGAEIAKVASSQVAKTICALKNDMLVVYEIIRHLRCQRDDLKATINTPRTDDFFEAVRNEAAHQILRWGTQHDAGKTNPDWFTLIVGLQGKAVRAYWEGNQEKLKHHIVSTAAALLNWLRALNGESSAMRPGIE